MKKILSLLALSCIGMGAWAAVQPEAGKLYKMHCAATSGHEHAQYLQYATNGNVNYNSTRGSYFTFEQGESAGQWYIKEAGSGMYLVVTATTANTAITLSTEHSTYWTTTEQSDGIRFLPNGTAGVFMNNNQAFALKTGTGGCSSWVLEEQADVVKGTSIDTGWYQIEVGDGTGANHAAHKGKFFTGDPALYNGNKWGASFTDTPNTDPQSWVYVNKVSEGNYTFTFNKDLDGATEYSVDQRFVVGSAGNFQFGPQNSTNDNFQFTIWGGSNYIVAYTLGGADFIGNTTTTNTANKTCYYVFHKVDVTNRPQYVAPQPPFVAAPDLGHMKDAKWYQLNVRNKYVKYNAADKTYSDELASANAEDNTRWFAFVGDNTNGYKIFNYAAGADVAMGAADVNTNTRLKAVPVADAQLFVYEKVTYNGQPAWQIREKNNSNAFLNQQGTNLGYWNANARGDIGNVFVFTEVEGASYNYVAFNCSATNNDENEITWKTAAFTTADAADASMVNGGEFISNLAISEADKTLGTGNYEFTVTASHSYPFAEGKFYLLKNRYTTNHVAVDDNEKTYARSTRQMVKPNYLWSFERVENTPDQFYVKNLELDKYLSGTSGVVSYNAAKTNAYTIWKDTQTNSATGFCLHLASSTSTDDVCIGSHAAGSLDSSFPNTVHTDGNTSLSVWTRNGSGGARKDNGSIFWVEEFDESFLDADPTIVGSYVSNDATKIEAYNGEKNAANLKAALHTLEEVLVDPEKYYTIRENVRTSNNNYMVVAPNADASGNFSENVEIGCYPSTDAANYTLVNSLFQFVENGEKYNIKHVNSGLNIYVATHNSHGNLTTGTAGEYSVVHYSADNTKVGFVNTDGVYLNTNSSLTRVDGWKDVSTVENSDGDRWTVKEVMEIPVTVGSVGYTTINLPVAVTIPAEVTAYKVIAENENSMTLVEVGGSVPAKTPLIIEAAPMTYDFVIATSGNEVAENKLLGTTARRTGFVENSFYALAADDSADLGVSFKINGSVSAIPANKAYLPVSTSGSNRALYFDFGGTTTSIDAVEALPATDALYNINGQRVVAPTRGIYVKANGQKVFIK